MLSPSRPTRLDFFGLLNALGAKLEAVADDGKASVKFGALRLVKIDADLVEHALDLLGDLAADVDALFGQGEHTLISLLRRALAHKIALRLEVVDSTRNGGLILLAELAQLGALNESSADR